MKNTTNISLPANTSDKFSIALCGNPNCGKTTLFNLLTDSNQKVGNWPGVTIEQKTGLYKKNPQIAIVDTPGIYSLSPFSADEQVAQNYLLSKPSLILNIVDCTNLERNLFLTSQLAELGIPMVVALNMQDEALSKGIFVDANVLERKFGCKFFPISAAKNIGVDELMHYCCEKKFTSPKNFKYCDLIENAVDKLLPFVKCHYNKRWLALKLLNDKTATEIINATKEQQKEIDVIRSQLCAQLDNNVATQIAEERYTIISQTVKQAQITIAPNKKTTNAQKITEKIDKIVLNKWLAFPIFALVMATVFYLSVGGLGGWLTSLVSEKLTPLLQNAVGSRLEAVTNAQWLRSLICDGIIAGVMSVVSFVPQIMLLFGFIAILEASGYMSRIAFITDRLLNKIGLGGRSFVSMILGCGCSVPAIMATRTIKNTDERNSTITLTPFMPCSAKLAVISFFTTHLLGGNALFAISFYFLSIFVVILGGLVLKVLHRNHSDNNTFIMELPTYRAPTLRNVTKQMWERGKAFLGKAGTVIFVASVVLWILQGYNFRMQAVDAQHSMLATLGKLIAPIFVPLGFDDGGYGWQFAISTLTGIAAKETVVTTLQILLPNGIENCISGLGAYSFVTYNLLTIPCVATISASFSEQGSGTKAIKSALFQFAMAYIVSLTIYQLGTFAKNCKVFTTLLCCAVLIVAILFSLRHLVAHRHCSGCCNNCHSAICSHK